MNEWPADKVERWRSIPGFDGYEASSKGRIRSLAGKATDGRVRKGRVLRPWQAGAYLQVSLGQDVKIAVHRIVAMAFHGMPPTRKHEVAHINGISTDNRSINLHWITRTENEQEKRMHGTYFTRVGKKGESHHKAKLTDVQIKSIRAHSYRRGDLTRLAMLYGVSRSTIGRIAAGKLWTHV